MRAAIWRNTLITATLYLLPIFAVDRLIQSRLHLEMRAVEVALAFAIVQIAAVLLMVIGLFVRKEIGVIRRARSEKLGPQIREALALHAIGTDRRQRLEQLHQQAPHDVREALFAMLVSTRGEPRERMTVIATELGLAEDTEEGKIERMRRMIRLRQAESFESIVAMVARESLLVRSIAAEELAVYAAQIGESVLARALQSTEIAIAMTTLDMLRAWRRAIHVTGFERFLAHDDPRVRERALLVLPYSGAHLQAESIAPAIIASLSHEKARVRVAAAHVAGEFAIVDAVPTLTTHLVDPDREVGVAAAFALAKLGERGHAALQRAVMSPDRTAASVAFEAVEKEALGLVHSR